VAEEVPEHLVVPGECESEALTKENKELDAISKKI
jgi:hypothetical protein